jgi:hypothetical protein
VKPTVPTLTEHDTEVRRRLADAVPEAGRDAAWAAYEAARVAGLCHEGAWEVALGAVPAERPPECPVAHRPSQI